VEGKEKRDGGHGDGKGNKKLQGIARVSDGDEYCYAHILVEQEFPHRREVFHG
jgi:hypothetical protein